MKLRVGKPSLTVEDIQKFVDGKYFLDENNFNINCSNYKDLAAYIKRRYFDYLKSKVSIENIKGMSFLFKGSIEDFEEETSCPVCLIDYEIDQEVCRLPCNHFCCRVCTERMFSTSNPGLKSNVLCPICRDDCT